MNSVVRKIIGAPRRYRDPSLFHKMSLVPLMAWVGLGADGLSSSAYGPEQAYRALGSHTYLTLILAAATALTVAIISYTYTRVIEHFPFGGGGYVVANRMLGEKVGAISGSALIVDYILTITVSIASCADAIFSYLPPLMHEFKVPFAVFLILFLITMNIRGIRESITILAPIFLTFLVMHIILFITCFVDYGGRFPALASSFQTSLSHDLSTIGFLGVFLLIIRAYSLGGGTYTGIEAVSDGLQNLREPRISNGKKTMVYMAVSLAFTAGALFIGYVLVGIRPEAGKTLNAVLANELFGNWPFGQGIAFLTLLSEGALLLVAAQTGFAGGPQIMANMAMDYWFPHRFANLSIRLTMMNGILLMGGAAIFILLYTRGSVAALVVMYSINVFLTFSLSQLGMLRYYLQPEHRAGRWKWYVAAHSAGLLLCVTILVITSFEKFLLGGWLTYLITTLLIGVCFLIHRHYLNIQREMERFDEILMALPTAEPGNIAPPDPTGQTAIQLVSGYNGFGIHTLLSIARNFPNLYKNVIFVSAAVIDTGSFKGADSVDALDAYTRESLEKYVDLARRLGFSADYRMVATTRPVESLVELCREVHTEFPRSTVFTGQLSFYHEKIYHRFLHNYTALAIQRRLNWEGITTVVLPMRVV